MTDRLEEARGLLDTMAAAGHPPDVRAFNILLKGCSLEGASGLDLMAAVLDTMEKAGEAPLLVGPHSHPLFACQNLVHWLYGSSSIGQHGPRHSSDLRCHHPN